MKKIEVWTFKTCPFCVRALNLLDSLGINYENHVLPWGDSYLKVLEEKTACDTLPQIFADGDYIGDCSHIHDLHQQGLLLDMLGA